MSSSEKTIEELALEERKFLHDISNQLVIAQGMSSFLEKALKNNSNVGEKELDRIQKVTNSVKKIVELVKERRALLHSLSEDS